MLGFGLPGVIAKLLTWMKGVPASSPAGERSQGRERRKPFRAEVNKARPQPGLQPVI